ncbi:hypothetical protein IFM89_028523 [Coptis chinensis]|uniref:SAM domain-containing protein n=1 Tax=Coptis chinensis TaxID=261450 RepID=A0A835M4G2_9MAGN|nr:hypothetical protein IFM89_028523 [Coptis chinensis]
MPSKSRPTQSTLPISDDDDDFQNPTQLISSSLQKNPNSKPLKPSNSIKLKNKSKLSVPIGKENIQNSSFEVGTMFSFEDVVCSQFELESRLLESSRIDCPLLDNNDTYGFNEENHVFSSLALQSPEVSCENNTTCFTERVLFECNDKGEFESKKGYVSNSIESRLLASRRGNSYNVNEDFEAGTQLNDLIELCLERGDEFPEGNGLVDGLVECPLCGIDISDMSEELRHVHTNECLDKNDLHKVDPSTNDTRPRSPQRVADVSAVLQWLRGLGLSRYEESFVKEEVDWETLQWLTEEDLLSIGVTALGPRKKIINALNELRKGSTHANHRNGDASKVSSDENTKLLGNKLITEYFPGSLSFWFPFQDAFRYLRGDCSHWFLTHFHIDRYVGRLPGPYKELLPWEDLLLINYCKAWIEVTCLDANHCPGAIIILFEPPNGKVVLHTGDFRFSEEMAKVLTLQSCAVQTLILDTTYCNPQYDFPKQEAVIQFVIEAIQAEDFNPKTLVLIGSYTIGKERLFLEVARCLRKKVYVGAAKLHTLRCLEFPEEDMKWFTSNEKESHIHVVPLWTIASFKRMKHISNQYLGRFNSIVAFSPTGWTFGKGKKKSQGRRWKQGTLIRYEVPYSEHCSFTELQEFVQFISPENIIPSVNNDGPESVDTMIGFLKS